MRNILLTAILGAAFVVYSHNTAAQDQKKVPKNATVKQDTVVMPQKEQITNAARGTYIDPGAEKRKAESDKFLKKYEKYLGKNRKNKKDKNKGYSITGL